MFEKGKWRVKSLAQRNNKFDPQENKISLKNIIESKLNVSV